MRQLLESFPVHVQIPVAWGDMDAFQHVNNVMYFRYFETARVAYINQVGFMEMRERTGIGPILASTQCRYRIPLTYPDTITVGIRVSEIKEDRFAMKLVVVSGQFRKSAAEGTDMIVCFDYRAGKKTPLPGEIRQRILDLEPSLREG